VTVMLGFALGCAQNKKEQKETQSVKEHEKGVHLAGKGDFDEAIVHLSEVIRLNPDYAKGFYNRGIAHGNRRDLEKAIADLDEAIRLNPDFALAYYNRSKVHKITGDLNRAKADLKRAKELDPNIGD